MSEKRSKGGNMKYVWLSLVCAAGLLLQPYSAGATGTWYALSPDEQYVADFTLNAGASRTVTINSDKELVIGFKSGVTPEQQKKYMRDDAHQLSFIQEETGAGMLGVAPGAESPFSPVNGKIEITAHNTTQENFKIVIYKNLETE